MNVIKGGLDEVNGCDSMQLLSRLLQMEIQGDVVLPQIFGLEMRGVDLSIEVVKDHYPP